MKSVNLIKAKEMFQFYRGNHGFMYHDGVYDEYKSFHVSYEVEYQWLEEMKKEALDELNQATNNKTKAEAFAKYGQLIALLKDVDGLQHMLSYTKSNIDLFDSNTLLRNILMITDTVRAFKDNKLVLKMKKEVLTMLKNALKKPIYISDDYKENGILPDYLTNEKIILNMKNLIKYWEKA